MKKKDFLAILFLLLSMIVIYGCSNNKASTDSTDTNVKVTDNKEDKDKENAKISSDDEKVNDEDKEDDEDDLENKKNVSSGSADSKFAVPGYKVGEIPAIEMPVLPDLLITEKPEAKIKLDITKDLASVPGVTVTPVKIEDACWGSRRPFGGGWKPPGVHWRAGGGTVPSEPSNGRIGE